MKTTLMLLAATLAAADMETISTIPDRVLGTTTTIPTWGVTCMTSAVSAIGCDPADVGCLCSRPDDLVSAARECMVSACETATASSVVPAATPICTTCV